MNNNHTGMSASVSEVLNKAALDTSGTVALTPLETGHPNPIPTTWDDLSPFTQGYIEALFANLLTTRNLLKRMGWDYSPAHNGYIHPNHLKPGGRADSWDSYPSDVWSEEVLEIEGLQSEKEAWERNPLAISDLASETLARIIADCDLEQKRYNFADTIAPPVEWWTQEGRDFWRYRQADCFPRFPPLTVQLCDDGKVRFSQAEGAA